MWICMRPFVIGVFLGFLASSVLIAVVRAVGSASGVTDAAGVGSLAGEKSHDAVVAAALQSQWGEAPSRRVEIGGDVKAAGAQEQGPGDLTGCSLTRPAADADVGEWRRYVESLEAMVKAQRLMQEMDLLPSQLESMMSRSALVPDVAALFTALDYMPSLQSLGDALRLEEAFLSRAAIQRGTAVAGVADPVERLRLTREFARSWFERELEMTCSKLFELGVPVQLVEAMRSTHARRYSG